MAPPVFDRSCWRWLPSEPVSGVLLSVANASAVSVGYACASTPLASVPEAVDSVGAANPLNIVRSDIMS